MAELKKQITEGDKLKRSLPSLIDRLKEADANKGFDALLKVCESLEALNDPAATEYRAGLLVFIEEGKSKLQEGLVAEFVKSVWTLWKKWLDGSIAKKDLKNVLAYKQKLIDNTEKSRAQLEKSPSGVKVLEEIKLFLENEVDSFIASASGAPTTITTTTTTAPTKTTTPTPTPTATTSAKEIKKETPVQPAATKPVKEEEKKEEGEKKLKRIDNNGTFPQFDDKGKAPAAVIAIVKKINAWTRTLNKDFANVADIAENIESEVAELTSPSQMAMKRDGVLPYLDKITGITSSHMVPLTNDLKSVDSEDWALTEMEKSVQSAQLKIAEWGALFARVFDTSKAQEKEKLAIARSNVPVIADLLKEYLAKKHSGDTIVDELRCMRRVEQCPAAELFNTLDSQLVIVEKLGTPGEVADVRKAAEQTQAQMLANWAIKEAKSKCFDEANKYLSNLDGFIRKHPSVSLDAGAIRKQVEELEQAKEKKKKEATEKVKMPERNFTGSQEEAQKIEEAAIQLVLNHPSWGKNHAKVEYPVAAVITDGNWTVFRKEAVNQNNTIVQVPVQWQIGVHVLIFRSEKKGWEKNSYKLFHLVFHAREGGITETIKEPPFVSIGVCGSIDFSESNVPDASLELTKKFNQIL